MTKYRGYKIQKEVGGIKRETWYNVILNSVILYRAETEIAAMQWIDKNIKG